MQKELWKKIKNILKNNKLSILLFLLLLFLITFEFPYTISKTGGTINLSSRIESENKDIESGNFNMAYVSEVPATLFNLFIASINPNWDIEKQIDSRESVEEQQFRGKISLQESIHNAIKIAYQTAGISIQEKDNKLYITYIYPEAKTNLKVGDQIIKMNDIDIQSKNDIQQLLSNLEVNSKISLEIIRNKKIYQKEATIQNIQDKKIIGIVVSEVSELVLDPNITIQFKKTEFGASGGLMMSLAIYDNITGFDLSKGRKIAGTGTIDSNGIVGQIDGIKYKLRGAVKAKMDIFLVPAGENYNQAIEEKKMNNYNIEIVPIKNLEEAITYLKK